MTNFGGLIPVECAHSDGALHCVVVQEGLPWCSNLVDENGVFSVPQQKHCCQCQNLLEMDSVVCNQTMRMPTSSAFVGCTIVFALQAL